MSLLILIPLVVAAMTDVFAHAPEGWEDAEGFHFGRAPEL